jgi:hypothetical protein
MRLFPIISGSTTFWPRFWWLELIGIVSGFVHPSEFSRVTRLRPVIVGVIKIYLVEAIRWCEPPSRWKFHWEMGYILLTAAGRWSHLRAALASAQSLQLQGRFSLAWCFRLQKWRRSSCLSSPGGPGAFPACNAAGICRKKKKNLPGSLRSLFKSLNETIYGGPEAEHRKWQVDVCVCPMHMFDILDWGSRHIAWTEGKKRKNNQSTQDSAFTLGVFTYRLP